MGWNDDETEVNFEMAPGSPHVARLTPTLAERVELEGWVTSSAVMAQNHNSSRSNRPRLSSTRSSDGDADGDGVSDADEDDELVAYLDGKPIVGERFTVCLPDAEVPGGNGSIAEAVTPERLIEYLTGQYDGDGRVYSWGTPKAGPGDPDDAGDCDDDDPGNHPGAVCGTTPHFVAEVSGPRATGGSLEVVRADDGPVAVITSPPEAGGGPAVVRVGTHGGSDGPESSTEAIYQAWSGASDGGGKATPEIFETLVAQVLVQPPGCPHPFPALLYVGRAESDGQLIYSGGWVIDDAALYEDSMTMLTMVDAAPVVGIDLDDVDSDGDGFGDAVERADSERRRRVVAGRSRRGARLDAGTMAELVEKGVLPEGAKAGIDSVRRKMPGQELETDEGPHITHLALDAPVLHLVNANGASNEVKFKAGAELSGQVN
ncbi:MULTISPECIES: hypothetical protein [Salinibaculum]|uniref:hypothetical protein n=1 Tax=Salinibaculum TaxID=2732368 RepID=UPI0030D11E56